MCVRVCVCIYLYVYIYKCMYVYVCIKHIYLTVLRANPTPSPFFSGCYVSMSVDGGSAVWDNSSHRVNGRGTRRARSRTAQHGQV